MRFVYFILWATMAVLVDVSLSRVAFGAVVPSLVADLRLDYSEAGLVSGSNAFGYLLMSAVATKLAMRIGLRNVAIIGHLVAAAGFAAAAFATNISELVLFRIVSGLGSGAGMVAALRLALDVAGTRHRVLVSTCAWSGAGFGLVFAAIAVPWLHFAVAWRVSMWISAALALLIAVVAPPETPVRAQSLPATVFGEAYQWQASALILGAYWLFGFAFLAYSTFSAIAPTSASPFYRFLWIGVMAIVGSASVARTSPAERAMGIMLLCGALAAASTAMALPIGDLLFGLGLTAVPGLATSIIRERATESTGTEAIAFSTIAIGIGQSVGPLAAGAAAEHYGIRSAFILSSIAYAFGLFCIVADEFIGRVSRLDTMKNGAG